MEKIKLDDITKFKFLSDPKYSPDGEYAAFIVHRMDVEENKYRSNIWVYDVGKDRYFQLTSFDEEGSFIWLDSDTILFPGYRNPKDKEKLENDEDFTRFYKISVHGGEAVEAFTVNKKVTDIKSVDGETYVFTASFNLYKREFDGLSDEEKKDELKKRKEERDYQVIDEIPYWANGKGFVNKDRNRLYLYHSETGNITPITDEYTDVDMFNLSSDGSRLVFNARTYTNRMPITSDVYIYDLKSGELKKLNKDSNLVYGYVDFLDDNMVITSGSDMKRYGINENKKFYIFDLTTEERSLITPDLDMSLGNSVGSDSRYGHGKSFKVDNGCLYFISTERFNACLNKLDRSGKIERVIDGDGTVEAFDIKDGEILFIGFRNLMIGELYTFENGEERQITEFNEWLQNEKVLSKPERVEVETEPGVQIDGWVMKPADFDESKKYPAILDIHGGPKTVYGEIYFHEMQYWASEGYFVFFCNPRGSDGRGNEFSDIRGKYGTIDYEDIMKFTDYVLEKYTNIDPSRVGVTGGSYGGFMTNWIIGHTDRFRAAASQRSISNWISDFGTTDIGYYFNPDQVGGTPWDNAEKYWEHSPLKYADKVKTPTLFIHSDEDYRCWMGEGLQMFTALKYFGVEARLCLFHGENHELSRSGKPKHRIRRLKEITEWFNGHLK
ncbi:MAG: S9 family peptidase [Thermoanaerobacteraceae bacterium]|nr:S9 family peptidase [Thermoanaerobacteraceae bacterium]